MDDNLVYENETICDLNRTLSAYCESRGITDMKKESQSVWNAALMFIRSVLYPTKDSLKSHELRQSGATVSNNNSYDYEKVNELLQGYVFICFDNDKEISQKGFCLLTGINIDTLNSWERGENKINKSTSEITQKLKEFRQECLENKLTSGRQNPVGILAILNHHYGWNMPNTREQNNKNILPTSELEQLRGKLSDNARLTASKPDTNHINLSRVIDNL